MTTMINAALRWSHARDELRPDPDEPSRILAVDSWLVEDGLVRGWERHWTRFARSVERAGSNPGHLSRFARAVAQAIPRVGRWFPRVELVQTVDEPAALRLLLRTAPAPVANVRAWVTDRPRQRRDHGQKGPDLDLYAALQSEAAAQGADEAVLVDDEGRPIEGATSSLLWWDGDVLCRVADEAPILHGVTRQILWATAIETGVAHDYRRPRLDDLAGRETWLVNALQGIRVVTAWTGAGISAGPALQAPRWRGILNALRDPLP